MMVFGKIGWVTQIDIFRHRGIRENVQIPAEIESNVKWQQRTSKFQNDCPIFFILVIFCHYDSFWENRSGDPDRYISPPRYQGNGANSC